MLLKHGGDVNATENIQQTALHWAAVQGAIAAADVLLQNGARVEAADVNGYRVHVSFTLFPIWSCVMVGEQEFMLACSNSFTYYCWFFTS